ncbi:MAG TPA: hypothetical protein VL635_10990 [Trinickia sp.]|nr:hypothetical protein [Trinickia sp.]
MSLASVGGGYAPSPYEVGSSDFAKAQADMEKLNALKVTEKDYKDANATHGWGGLFNTFSDKSAKQALIKQQTKLEDDISKHLFKIAAANERGQVSPSLLKAAQGLGDDLQGRLTQDEKNADAADPSDHSSLTQDAYDRANPFADQNFQEALAFGNKPDVISLSDTPAFIKQVNALDTKIRGDIDTYQHGATQADRAAAKAQLSGQDQSKLQSLFDKVDQQTGFLQLTTPGVSGPKIASLPDGDPQKNAYLKQSEDLINLVRDNGTLFNDNTLLGNALNGQ